MIDPLWEKVPHFQLWSPDAGLPRPIRAHVGSVNAMASGVITMVMRSLSLLIDTYQPVFMLHVFNLDLSNERF